MGKQEILSLINQQFNDLHLNYFYMQNNSSEIIYPYITGEYYEFDYSFENEHTRGQMILEIWNRGTEYDLIEIKEIIKNKFKNYQKVIIQNNVKMGVSINYLSETPRRTEIEKLQKLEIILEINYWESEV